MTADPTRRSLLMGAATVTALSAGMPTILPAGARAQAQTATPSASADAMARADDIAAALQAGPVPAPGLSMAVANADGVIWTAALGKADVELDVAVTPQHRFKLQSVSKVLTATLAAKLASRGVIDLEAPVSLYLTGLPAQHRQTTLAQLLTHRGGVRHYIPRDTDPAAPGGPIDFRDYPDNASILAAFIDDPLVGPVGGPVVYSTFGFTLASLAMEAASGQAFTGLILSEMRDGFGLASLDTDDPFALRPMRATGYNDDIARFLLGGPQPTPGAPVTLTHARQVSTAYKVAGGGLILSVPDLALFGAAHLDSPESKVTAEERAMLFTQRTEATEDSPALGLGWRVNADGKGRLRWHHAGGNEGGRSGLIVYPDLGLSIAMAGNVVSAPGDVLTPASDLADAFL